MYGGKVLGKSDMELPPFVRRMPMPKKTGNKETDDNSEVTHKALQKIICLLLANPSVTLETLGKLQIRLEGSAVAQAAEAGAEFEAGVTTLGKVPSEWWASWVQQLSGGALKDSDLVKILKHDSSLDRMVTFGAQMASATVLPQECHIKKVLARVLHERSRAVGTRINRDWLKKAVNISGVIDWKHGCIWALAGRGDIQLFVTTRGEGERQSEMCVCVCVQSM